MSRNVGFTISILYIKPIFLFIKTYFIYLKNKIYFLKKCHIVDSFIWGTFLLFFFSSSLLLLHQPENRLYDYNKVHDHG